MLSNFTCIKYLHQNQFAISYDKRFITFNLNCILYIVNSPMKLDDFVLKIKTADQIQNVN